MPSSPFCARLSLLYRLDLRVDPFGGNYLRRRCIFSHILRLPLVKPETKMK